MRLLPPPLTLAACGRRPLEAPVDRIGGGTGVSVGLVVSVRTCRVCAGA